MDKQAVIRRVRIAVSIFFGLLIVALCVLWMRSYFQREGIHIYVSNFGEIDTGSTSGRIRGMVVNDYSDSTNPSEFSYWSRPARQESPTSRPVVRKEGSWHFRRHEVGFEYIVPFWFPVLLISILVALAWLLPFPTNFSLRTMLIATTLVAVVLGVAAWAV